MLARAAATLARAWSSAGWLVARIDAREHLIGLDRLIVFDRHLADVARHFGADQDRMRLYISVIGRHQEAAHRSVVVAINHGRRKKHRRRSRDQ